MSITCEEFHRFMSEFLDDELPAEQREFFALHIERCPPCVNFMGSFTTTVELVRRCEGGHDQGLEYVPEQLIAAILAARAVAPRAPAESGEPGEADGSDGDD